MLKLFLCLRYLRKKKIVFLSIAAVALSVSLLIVVASLFSGFIKAVESAAAEALGDVVISPPPMTEIPEYPLLVRRLEQTQTVEAATASLRAPGLLRLDTGIVRPVEVWGIEPVGLTRVTGFKKNLLRQKDSPAEPSFDVPGNPGKTGGFVGIAVLGEPDEQTDEYDMEAVEKIIGEQVILTTGTASGAEINRRLLPFSIADVIETGVYFFDKGSMYLPVEELQRRLYPEAESPLASQIHIKLADNSDTEVALSVIEGVWRNFVEDELDDDPILMYQTAIMTSKELQRPFIAAYQKQMGILLVIFGVISLGVVLLVFCIFYMIVRIKQKDIAIIRSCGTARTSVALLFVEFGLCVGVIGSTIGAVLGWIITVNINTVEEWIRIIFGLKLWKSSVYLFSRIPDEVDWPWALLFMTVATIAAAIGTLIPAVVAAITKPVNILQYE
jgi:lipoprotein-releasing system permease protein